jgi:hypothetical protein
MTTDGVDKSTCSTSPDAPLNGDDEAVPTVEFVDFDELFREADRRRRAAETED